MSDPISPSIALPLLPAEGGAYVLAKGRLVREAAQPDLEPAAPEPVATEPAAPAADTPQKEA